MNAPFLLFIWFQHKVKKILIMEMINVTDYVTGRWPHAFETAPPAPPVEVVTKRTPN